MCMIWKMSSTKKFCPSMCSVCPIADPCQVTNPLNLHGNIHVRSLSSYMCHTCVSLRHPLWGIKDDSIYRIPCFKCSWGNVPITSVTSLDTYNLPDPFPLRSIKLTLNYSNSERKCSYYMIPLKTVWIFSGTVSTKNGHLILPYSVVVLPPALPQSSHPTAQS